MTEIFSMEEIVAGGLYATTICIKEIS